MSRRTLALLWRFYARLEVVAGALALVGVPSLAALLQLAPWWLLLVGVGVLVLYVVALAVYEKFTEVEDRKNELEKKLEERQKRRAVKDLLANAVEQGNILRQSHRKDTEGRITLTSHQDVVDWVHRTHDLIEAAFDKAEALHFMNSDDYEPEKPLP